MNEVYEAIREGDEQRELEEVIPHWDICCVSVQRGVAFNFSKEEWNSAYGHDWQSTIRLCNFLANLVFQKLGVVERSLVEYEDVRKSCANIIEHQTENPVIHSK